MTAGPRHRRGCVTDPNGARRPIWALVDALPPKAKFPFLAVGPLDGREVVLEVDDALAPELESML